MSFFKRLKNIIISNINSSKPFDSSFLDVKMQDFDTRDFNYKTEDNFSEYEYSSRLNSNETQDVEAQYYANLELPYGSGFEEIKKSYKMLLKKYHPDKFHNDKKKYKVAQELVTKLNMAYNYFEEKYKK